MNEFQKVQIISQEIDRLRHEITVGARATHRIVFVFLTVFVGIISVYFGKGLVNETQKAMLILLVSQVEVLLTIFCASLLSYQYVRVGYVRVLEDEINSLVKENMIIWHSKVTPKYMTSPYGAFFFACFLQGVAYVLIFGVLTYFTFEITNNFLWGVAFTIEGGLCLALHIWATFEIKVAARYAKQEQGKARE